MCTLPTQFACAPRGARGSRSGLHVRALALIAALLCWLPPPAACAQDIEVETSRKGDLIEVRAQATISSPLALVWRTLTDYERSPEFISGLKKVRVIARNGPTTTIEQSGEARFLFLAIPIDVTLEVTERPPILEVRRIAGNLRHLQGRYETLLLRDPSLVQLRWTGSIAPESELPPLIGEALMRMLIREQFEGMVTEIERRVAAARLALPAPATQ